MPANQIIFLQYKLSALSNLQCISFRNNSTSSVFSSLVIIFFIGHEFSHNILLLHILVFHENFELIMENMIWIIIIILPHLLHLLIFWLLMVQISLFIFSPSPAIALQRLAHKFTYHNLKHNYYFSKILKLSCQN